MQVVFNRSHLFTKTNMHLHPYFCIADISHFYLAELERDGGLVAHRRSSVAEALGGDLQLLVSGADAHSRRAQRPLVGAVVVVVGQVDGAQRAQRDRRVDGGAQLPAGSQVHVVAEEGRQQSWSVTLLMRWSEFGMRL